MPTPPVTVPNGQSVVWSYASSWVPHVGNPTMGTASATQQTGQVTQSASGPLANSNESVTWSGFTIPNELTRPGNHVYAIYPVFTASYQVANTVCGLNLLGTPVAGAPWNGTAGTGSNTWFTNSGTNISVLSSSIVLSMNQTLGPQTFPIDSISASFVGVAIYIDKLPIPSVFIGISNDSYQNIGG